VKKGEGKRGAPEGCPCVAHLVNGDDVLRKCD